MMEKGLYIWLFMKHIIIQISMKNQGFSGDLHFTQNSGSMAMEAEPNKDVGDPNYQECICCLFETVQGKFKNYQIQVIRSLLFYVRHIFHKVSELKEQPTPPLQQSLNTVFSIFVKKIYDDYPVEDLQIIANLQMSAAQINSFSQLKDLTNPFQILEEFKNVLNSHLYQAAANLITLSLTKTQFYQLKPEMLAVGCVEAIKELKNLQDEIENPETEAQVEEAKQLYLGLLSKIDEMCQSL